MLKAFLAYTLVLWLLGAVVMVAYFGLKYKKDAALVTLAGIAYVQNKCMTVCSGFLSTCAYQNTKNKTGA